MVCAVCGPVLSLPLCETVNTLLGPLLFILSVFLAIVLLVVLLVDIVIIGYLHPFYYFLTGFLRILRTVLIFLTYFMSQLVSWNPLTLLLVGLQLILLGFSGGVIMSSQIFIFLSFSFPVFFILLFCPNCIE